MLCTAVPPLDGLGCSGVALKNSIWRRVFHRPWAVRPSLRRDYFYRVKVDQVILHEVPQPYPAEVVVRHTLPVKAKRASMTCV
jgi:hypothetical protein